MSKFSYLEVREYLKSFLLDESEETSVLSGFSIDSRTIKHGETFVALKGVNFNGHNFIKEAIPKGARNVICQDDDTLSNLSAGDRAILFKVEDTYNFIYQLAKYKRSKFSFPIIAVTGSNGKTTVKELIAALLSSQFSVYKNYLNQNNILGLSLNILNCGFDYDYGVFEVGISKEGEMDMLLDILKPDHGLITNISATHLEFLRDEEIVFQEKMKLFQSLKEGSFAFYSKDQDRFKSLDREIEIDLKFKTFGFKENNDHWLNIDNINLDGLKLNYKNNLNLSSKLLGYKNSFNIIAALSVAVEFGLDLNLIKKTLFEFRPLNSRMNYEKCLDLDIIDDSYNSSPQALVAGLEFISSLNYDGLKIAVLSDMLELGSSSDNKHLEIGAFAANLNIDYYFCYGVCIRHFIQGLNSQGFPKERIIFLNKEILADKIVTIVNQTEESCMLFFKASHTMGIDDIIKRVKKRVG